MTEIPIEVKLAQEKTAWEWAQKEKESGEITNTAQKIVIKGVDIPFGDLVTLLVKIAFAAIPAGIIITIIWGLIAAFLGGLLK